MIFELVSLRQIGGESCLPLFSNRAAIQGVFSEGVESEGPQSVTAAMNWQPGIV